VLAAVLASSPIGDNVTRSPNCANPRPASSIPRSDSATAALRRCTKSSIWLLTRSISCWAALAASCSIRLAISSASCTRWAPSPAAFCLTLAPASNALLTAVWASLRLSSFILRMLPSKFFCKRSFCKLRILVSKSCWRRCTRFAVAVFNSAINWLARFSSSRPTVIAPVVPAPPSSSALAVSSLCCLVTPTSGKAPSLTVSGNLLTRLSATDWRMEGTKGVIALSMARLTG